MGTRTFESHPEVARYGRTVPAGVIPSTSPYADLTPNRLNRKPDPTHPPNRPAFPGPLSPRSKDEHRLDFHQFGEGTLVTCNEAPATHWALGMPATVGVSVAGFRPVQPGAEYPFDFVFDAGTVHDPILRPVTLTRQDRDKVAIRIRPATPASAWPSTCRQVAACLHS